LIDFAEARQDYVLHDFLRLETEVMTHVVAEIIRRYDLPPALTIYNFYVQLYWAMQRDNPAIPPLPHADLARPFVILVAIRQVARRYLFNFDDFNEYYEGLIMYLMGALKFRNLDSLTKQIAFWGAATIQQLVTNPPEKPPTTPLSRRKIYSALLLAPLAIGVGLWLAWPQRSNSNANTVTPMPPTATHTVEQIAFNSPLPTPTLAPSATAKATATLTHTPVPATNTPNPTATATVTPSRTHTPVPATATPLPGVNITKVYSLPTLISPESGANLSFKMATFTWTWTGQTLANEDAFELRVWQKNDETHFGAFDAREITKQPNADGQYSLTLDLSAAASVTKHGNSGDYFWSVAIVQIDPEYQDLNLETEPRSIQINVFGGGGGGGGSNNNSSNPNSGRPTPGPLP